MLSNMQPSWSGDFKQLTLEVWQPPSAFGVLQRALLYGVWLRPQTRHIPNTVRRIPSLFTCMFVVLLDQKLSSRGWMIQQLQKIKAWTTPVLVGVWCFLLKIFWTHFEKEIWMFEAQQLTNSAVQSDRVSKKLKRIYEKHWVDHQGEHNGGFYWSIASYQSPVNHLSW